MSDTARPAGAPAAGGGGINADVASLSFEEALGELEHIVRGLEGGQQKLEEAIAAYERGTALRRHCETKLMEVEGRVAAIVESGGTVTLRPVE